VLRISFCHRDPSAKYGEVPYAPMFAVYSLCEKGLIVNENPGGGAR
jgi:hypothetical protein